MTSEISDPIEAGFYWIKSDPYPRAEIAQWDGHFNWWTAGADQPIQIGTVKILSRRLTPPPEMSDDMRIEIIQLPHGADLELPAYATEHAAGMDLRAAVPDPVTIGSGATRLIPTGIAIAVPSGHEAQIRPRSGLALRHGVTVLNAPGTIDADYRAEVGVILVNHGRFAFTVNRGDRIAQMVVAPVIRVEWKPVAKLPDTARGAGGFGSTGG